MVQRRAQQHKHHKQKRVAKQSKAPSNTVWRSRVEQVFRHNLPPLRCRRPAPKPAARCVAPAQRASRAVGRRATAPAATVPRAPCLPCRRRSRLDGGGFGPLATTLRPQGRGDCDTHEIVFAATNPAQCPPHYRAGTGSPRLVTRPSQAIPMDAPGRITR